MAITVNNAFNEFLTNSVRLDSERAKAAISSKNWLIEQISNFPSDGNFPTLHESNHIEYGSFSRKTKIRPLDDVDLMIILHAQGATYNEHINPTTVYNSKNALQFNPLSFEDNSGINSIKVINKFKEYLLKIPQYKKADIKRNQEAVTLELQTVEWVYDIVPCFITNPEPDGRTYYLIPDGKGNWQKTDPRIDKQRTVDISAKHAAPVLDIIRLLKYWNTRPTMPSIQSYLLEILALYYFEGISSSNSIPTELQNLFSYISSRIHFSINDPKHIQGDLNTLSWDDREKIRIRATQDYQRAHDAIQFQLYGQSRDAINKWREIFGPEFPVYS